MSNIEPEEIEDMKKAILNTDNKPQGRERQSSIPSDVTMQSIDSLEELIVTNPTNQHNDSRV